MNFISRVYCRIPLQALFSKSINNFQNFSTSSAFCAKYGKLINDHVSNAFYLPIVDGGENTLSDMATVLYNKEKGVLNLHHTQVPQHLEGKGIGHDIAKEVFDYCSARNLKIVLTCEFLQQYYKENPQYKDLVLVRENMKI